MEPFKFLSLPQDIVQSILDFTPQSGLHALCLVSRRIRKLAEPHLYRHVHLTQRITGHQFPIAKLARTLCHRPELHLLPRSFSFHTIEDPFIGYPEVAAYEQCLTESRETILEDICYQSPTETKAGEYIGELREHSSLDDHIGLLLQAFCNLEVVDLQLSSQYWFQGVWEYIQSNCKKVRRFSFNSDTLISRWLPYPTDFHNVLELFNLPSLECIDAALIEPTIHGLDCLGMNLKISNVHSLTLRRAKISQQSLQSILKATPQLRSLVVDFFYDLSSPGRSLWDGPGLVQSFEIVKDTLETLVFAMEFEQYEFQEAPIWDYSTPLFSKSAFDIRGFGDFLALKSLELPIVLLLRWRHHRRVSEQLPPTLENLILRADLLTERMSKYVGEDGHAEFAEVGDLFDDAGDMPNIVTDLVDNGELWTSHLRTLSLYQLSFQEFRWDESEYRRLNDTCLAKGVHFSLLSPASELERWDELLETRFEAPPLHADGETRRFAIEHGKCQTKVWRGERYGIPIGLAREEIFIPRLAADST